MAAGQSSPRPRFLKQALLFAAIHYLVLLGFGGAIILASHIPPKAADIGGLIGLLVRIEDVLVAPRKLILWLWPSEVTPRALGPFATVVNSVLWGAGLVAIKGCRQRPAT